MQRLPPYAESARERTNEPRVGAENINDQASITDRRQSDVFRSVLEETVDSSVYESRHRQWKPAFNSQRVEIFIQHRSKRTLKFLNPFPYGGNTFHGRVLFENSRNFFHSLYGFVMTMDDGVSCEHALTESVCEISA